MLTGFLGSAGFSSTALTFTVRREGNGTLRGNSPTHTPRPDAVGGLMRSLRRVCRSANAHDELHVPARPCERDTPVSKLWAVKCAAWSPLIEQKSVRSQSVQLPSTKANGVKSKRRTKTHTHTTVSAQALVSETCKFHLNVSTRWRRDIDATKQNAQTLAISLESDDCK